MKWRIDAEWAWQEQYNGKRLADCINTILGHLSQIGIPPAEGEMFCLTVNQITEIEVLFKTGLRVKTP